jgi:WD40 repeat protein
LASASKDHTIKLWDLITNKLETTLKGHNNAVISVCYSPDGSKLASGSWDCSIKLWDLRTNAVYATLNGHTNSVLSVRYS